MTAGALTNGYTTDTRLNCSSGVPGRQPACSRTTSRRLRLHRLREGARRSPATRSSTGSGYDFWLKYGCDAADVNAKDPLVERPRRSASASETGIDLPGEAAGRIADRDVEAGLLQGAEGLLLQARRSSRRHATSCTSSPASSASTATPTEPVTPSTSRSARATPCVTPLQLARATPRSPTAAPSTSPGSARRSSTPDGKVIKRIQPKVQAAASTSRGVLDYIDKALQGIAREGTMAWKLAASPSTRCTIRAKTGTAEVYGKQTHLVGRVVHQGLRRGDDDLPGRHRLRHLRRRDPERSARRSTASTATR